MTSSACVDSVLDTIGGTPLVRLTRMGGSDGAGLLGKWEAQNPGGSVKDRPALALVLEAERQGLLRPGGTIIEATSGNFGVALAMIGAARGYRVVIVTDPKLPPAFVHTMRAFGAELVEVTEPDDSGGFFKTRLARANELAAANPTSFRPDQHYSLVNALAHYSSTGPELLSQVEAEIDELVVAVSTAGQVRGLAEYFRQHSPGTRIVAIDAVGSGAFGQSTSPYLQTGIGLAWPPSNLQLDLVDEVYQVGDTDAFSTARLLALQEGMLVGASSGAVVFAGMALQQRRRSGNVVCILSDTGQRYLDTVYSDQWLAEQGVCLSELGELRSRAGLLRPLDHQQLATTLRGGTTHRPQHPPSTTETLNRVASLLLSGARHDG